MNLSVLTVESVSGDAGYPLIVVLMTPMVDTKPNTPQWYYPESNCITKKPPHSCR